MRRRIPVPVHRAPSTVPVPRATMTALVNTISAVLFARINSYLFRCYEAPLGVINLMSVVIVLFRAFIVII